ncbi:MAG: hypothetical protein LBC12_01500 [Nitrososphaerota archaeon]|jgi:hypothetical protein|nr:hypothetical protein [Nitrososphaerota archaeon]
MGMFIGTEDLGGGGTTNPTNVVGPADGNFARFYTPSLYRAAQVIGMLSSGVGTGTVKILAKLGPTSVTYSPRNLVSVWASQTGADWTWDRIGGAVVTAVNSGSPSWYTIGTTLTVYSYVVIEVNTLTAASPPSPGAVIYNDVLVDCVEFYW